MRQQIASLTNQLNTLQNQIQTQQEQIQSLVSATTSTSSASTQSNKAKIVGYIYTQMSISSTGTVFGVNKTIGDYPIGVCGNDGCTAIKTSMPTIAKIRLISTDYIGGFGGSDSDRLLNIYKQSNGAMKPMNEVLPILEEQAKNPANVIEFPASNGYDTIHAFWYYQLGLIQGMRYFFTFDITDRNGNILIGSFGENSFRWFK